MCALKLLIKSAEQAVLICNQRQNVLRGKEMAEICTLERKGQDGISLITARDGKIEFIGYDSEVQGKYADAEFEHVIDATGQCIMPGLVDAHTHPVWAGDRVHEFAMKLAGASYMEVHEAGGGIHYTVDHTRRASEDDLYTSFRDRLIRMQSCGTTLVECKSGYGLDWETEHKMLRVIQRAKHSERIGISSTFCGAHAVPRGSTSESATEDVINEQLPALKAAREAGLAVDNVDVFCEKGVFETDQSRRILEEGKKLGLNINFHGDELHPSGSAEMGSSLGALAISHLEEISDQGIADMAEAGSIGIILPTTAYMLRLSSPPVRKMIDGGMAVALGSDFNPNAYCYSMPMVMHLACVLMRMTMPEALVASTLNAAASLGLSHSHGSLEVGKNADLLLLNAPRWEHLIYQFGGTQHLIQYVIKNGDVIVKNDL